MFSLADSFKENRQMKNIKPEIVLFLIISQKRLETGTMKSYLIFVVFSCSIALSLLPGSMAREEIGGKVTWELSCVGLSHNCGIIYPKNNAKKRGFVVKKRKVKSKIVRNLSRMRLAFGSRITKLFH